MNELSFLIFIVSVFFTGYYMGYTDGISKIRNKRMDYFINCRDCPFLKINEEEKDNNHPDVKEPKPPPSPQSYFK